MIMIMSSPLSYMDHMHVKPVVLYFPIMLFIQHSAPNCALHLYEDTHNSTLHFSQIILTSSILH